MSVCVGIWLYMAVAVGLWVGGCVGAGVGGRGWVWLGVVGFGCGGGCKLVDSACVIQQFSLQQADPEADAAGVSILLASS